jgi:hypothetical protein
MIRVEITLDAGGLGLRKARIGYVEIANDCTGSGARGNYDVRVFDRQGKRVVRTARVENWPRNAKTATALIAEAFKQAYPDGVAA